MEQRTCSVAECAKSFYAKGWCRTHYERVRSHGSPDKPPVTIQRRWRAHPEFKPKHPDTCTVDGCDRNTHEGGLCSTHYDRKRRTGTVGGAIRAKVPNAGEDCGEPGCEKPARHRGRCRRHYVLATDSPSGHRFKGEGVSYGGMHDRLKLWRGYATDLDCVDCGYPAEEWSYDHADPNEKIGTAANGFPVPYSTDVEHYDPRCTSCHRAMDAVLGGRGRHIPRDHAGPL